MTRQLRYRTLIKELGLIKTVYRIAIQPDARSYTVSYPRRVPKPLLRSAEMELLQMRDMGRIKRVEEATIWCAPMAVVRKKHEVMRSSGNCSQLKQQKNDAYSRTKPCQAQVHMPNTSGHTQQSSHIISQHSSHDLVASSSYASHLRSPQLQSYFNS